LCGQPTQSLNRSTFAITQRGDVYTTNGIKARSIARLIVDDDDSEHPIIVLNLESVIACFEARRDYTQVGKQA